MSVSIAGSDITISSLPNESVLGTLHRAGFAMRVGCQRGGCGICKIQIDAGSIEYQTVVSEQALSLEDCSAGIALACRAVPVADITISIPTEGKLRSIAPMLTTLALRRVCRPTRAIRISTKQ